MAASTAIGLLASLAHHSINAACLPACLHGLQGTLVRRHKLPKEGGGFLGLADMAVGQSVKVYGK